jgi:hypothetical protein
MSYHCWKTPSASEYRWGWCVHPDAHQCIGVMVHLVLVDGGGRGRMTLMLQVQRRFVPLQGPKRGVCGHVGSCTW